MSRLLRYPKISNIYFITCVTDKRNPILIESVALLQTALSRTLNKYRISLQGYVVLPDHFHALVNVGHHDISAIMQMFKLSFGGQWRRHSKVSGKVWQSRFWDHMIRNEDDYKRHLDYIHYNPVKHGFVLRPFDWHFSSIWRYQAEYSEDWGIKEKLKPEGFGE